MAYFFSDFNHLPDVLRQRSRETPGRIAYTFLVDGEHETQRVTFGELDHRAQVIASYLAEIAKPGERAFLVYAPGLDFVAALFGCLFAGLVAIPLYPPRPKKRTLAFEALIHDAQPSVGLTSSSLLARVEDLALGRSELEGPAWLVTDQLEDRSLGGWAPPTVRPSDLALVQYTSGSTGRPRGVMLSHANLLHNEELIRCAFDQSEDSIVLGWLPFYHDMGLIGNLLQPLYTGARAVLMSPQAFLQRPLRWLAAISRYRATTSGGPNFAYDLCARRIGEEERADLDLSTWRVAFTGAEPVRAETLERFTKAFAPCGFRPEAFYPCYGLAEATLFVTGGAVGAAPVIHPVQASELERHRAVAVLGEVSNAVRRLVGCGHPHQQDILIVEPDSCRPCPEGRVGEIWIAGPSVAQGYWNRPEETEQVFRAVPAGVPKRPARYLRTGDLGFLRGTELFVTGRVKDLIIIRGRNYYPQDLELSAAASHPDLRLDCAAAFAIDDDSEERLVLVVEVRRPRTVNAREVSAAIRRKVAEEHEIQVHTVVLVRPGGVPKTTSGKIRRRTCRQSFLEGTLVVVEKSSMPERAPAAPPTMVPVIDRHTLLTLPVAERRNLLETYLDWLVRRVAGVAPTRHEPLIHLGLDSLMAMEFKAGIEADLGVPLSAADLLAGACLVEIVDEILFQVEAATEVETVGRVAGDAPQDFPLSRGQQALWLVEKLASGSAPLHIIAAARVRGALDRAALRRAFDGLIARHPALRTTFDTEAEAPHQRVHSHGGLEFHWQDAAALSEEAVRERLLVHACRPFDLADGPLFRVGVWDHGRGAAQEYVVSLALHHLVADFWSLAVMVRELGVLYEREMWGTGRDLPTPSLEFSDYVAWQEEWLGGAIGERQWHFWRDQLTGAPPHFDLPTDRPRPSVKTYGGATHQFHLGLEGSERLRAFCRARGMTLYTALLAAFQILLHRISGQGDVLVGSPMAGRTRQEFADLVGYLTNPVVLRSKVQGNPRGETFLNTTRGTVLKAFEHQEFPLQVLVERLLPARHASRSPFFEVMFVFQKDHLQTESHLAAFALGRPGARLELGGLEFESMELERRCSQFDLTLLMAELKDGVAGAFEYNSDLFDRTSIARWSRHLRGLLESLTADPGQRLGELRWLTAAEGQQLVVEWNDTRMVAAGTISADTSSADTIPTDTVLTRLGAMARHRADAVAVRLGERQLSYRELDRRSAQWSQRLQRLGIGPESRVGLCVERSLEMIVGMLSILRAGGAYLPLDPTVPVRRLQGMVEDAGLELVLTDRQTRDQLATAAPVRQLLVDGPWGDLAAEGPSSQVGEVHSEALAYVIYTSGSTGRPKGVAISHRNLFHLMRARLRVNRRPVSSFLLSPSFAFDASVAATFWTLSRGGTLVLCREREASAPHALGALVQRHRVSHWLSVPSLYSALLTAESRRLTSLTTVVVAGEACPVDLVRLHHRHLPGATLLNEYGPTEGTVWASVHPCTDSRLGEGDRRVPIGRPIPNVRAHLLDRRGFPLPIGLSGELHLGGSGIGRGYLNRPALTAEKFLPDPFAGLPGARLYATGDQVRALTDSNLEFQGRFDHQVKLRGFRIELGEIEAVLERHPGVAEAVVLFHRDGERLVAYHVPCAPRPTVDALRGFLAEHVPAYMVPTAWDALATMPRTPFGKVDRSALRQRALPTLEGGEESSFTAPSAIEALVLEIWSQLLGVERIGIRDDFFALGGHSLLATQVISRLRQAFGVEVPLHQLLAEPTVSALAERIRGFLGDGTDLRAPALGRTPRDRPLPLSFAQERLWFLDRLEPGDVTYNVPVFFRLRGPLDPAALAWSYREIVRRHEALRTRFVAVEGQPQQVIEAPVPLPVPWIDLRRLAAPRRRAESERLAVQAARTSFDLARGPLLRMRVLRLAARESVVLMTCHHIACDATSVEIFQRELVALCEAFSRHAPASLPELTIQYADFSAWQRRWLTREVLAPQLTYWRRQLADLPHRLELPTDRPRPALSSRRGGHLPFAIPAELGAALRDLSRRGTGTLFMTLLAAFMALLHRLTGQPDLCVGTPISGRSHRPLEALVGLFLNTLVLRSGRGEDPTFQEFLAQTRTTCLTAYAHQDLPFEQLVDALNPRRDLSQTPLFQVQFVLQPPDPPAPSSGVLSPRPFAVEVGGAKFDLTLSLKEHSREHSDGLTGWLEYRTDLFDSTTVQRLGRQFATLLWGLVRRPEEVLSRLPLASVAEKHQCLFEWATTPLPPGPTGEPFVHRRIAGWAERTPDTIALVCEGRQLSYRQFDERAARLAARLSSLGVVPGTLVGLCADRSPEAIVGLYAILKAGGAYVPLDSTLPTARLEFMLCDAGVSILVCDERLAARLRSAEVRVVDFHDRGAAEGPLPDGHREPVQLVPEHPVYVIYTSGSTGWPKGVVVTHGALNDYLHWVTGHCDVAAFWGAPIHSSLAFDLTLTALWPPLQVGRALELLPEEAEPTALASTWQKSSTTYSLIKLTPSQLELLNHQLPPAAAAGRTASLVIGGEPLAPQSLEFWRRYAPETRLINHYGPTEAVVGCCVHEVMPGERLGGRVPIGRPIGTACVRVLGPGFAALPAGVVGELHIGGSGIARGYHARPALTAARFIPDPFGGVGSRLYKSGDLCRWSAAGELEFLGRRDHQVKLRGFRIELGEVETALLRHPAVREAVVAVRQEAEDQRLVAFVVAKDGRDVGVAEVVESMRETLPTYMVPVAIKSLPALPLTPNRKVDRQALLDLEWAPEEGASTLRPRHVAPRTFAEQRTAEILGQVLGVSEVGLEDDFFDLGGHSLLAIRVVSRLRQALGVEIPLRQLFATPTVAGLAAVVEREKTIRHGSGAPLIEALPRDPEVPGLPLSFAQARLWFLDRLEPGSAMYNLPMVLRLSSPVHLASLERALHGLVERHEVLRTRFTEVAGEPLQIIDACVESPLPLVDLTSLPPREKKTMARRLAAAEARRPFDLVSGALQRCCLLRLTADEHTLLLTQHHIVSDGWSLEILIRELSALYDAFRSGRPSPLPALPVQYADFALWQRHWLTGEVVEAQLAFWRQRLAGAPALLELPTDRPRPPVQRHRGAMRFLALPEKLSMALRSLEARATLFMTLLTGFKSLLGRFAQQDDVVVGSPIANRDRLEIEGLIGFFVNTLALRTRLDRSATFAATLERVRERCLEAYAHQDLPFEKLVQELQPERSLSHAPLFQVMMVMQQGAPTGNTSLRRALSPQELYLGAAKFDLSLGALEMHGDGIHCVLRYDSDLFDSTTIDRLLGHLRTLLTAAAADPAQRLGELPLASAAEQHQLIVEWRDTHRTSPREALVHRLFEAQAAARPHAVALGWGDQYASFGALNHHAERLAGRLRTRGVGPEVVVGVWAERSLAMVAAVLAVLKAGGAYLPLDPSHPRQRLVRMVEDTKATILLAASGAAEELATTGLRRLSTAHDSAHDTEYGTEYDTEYDKFTCAGRGVPASPRRSVGPDNLAYVIYTSGSTGRPNGVMVRHRSVVNLLHALAGAVGTGRRYLGVGLNAPLAFDASVKQMFQLALGHTLHLVPEEIRQDGEAMLAFATDRRLDVLDATPSQLRLLSTAGLLQAERKSPRCWLVGGEPVGEDLWQRLAAAPRVVFYNVYGPTECTVDTTLWRISQCVAGPPTLGRGIANCSVVLLDPGLRPVPLGVVGELAIGGVGLARGYLYQPQRTAERFVPDAHGGTGSPSTGARLYRSGDLARWRPDGTLEFRGRRDHQIKLRGFRIELGEIEMALSQHPAVGEAVVALRQMGTGDSSLVAYVVPRHGLEFDHSSRQSLRQDLRETLPGYMIPRSFEVLAELPLGATGKVDRRQLPAPRGGREAAAGFVAPRNPAEEILAGIWSTLLGVEDIGVEDNFFELGGHSLLATQLVSRVREHFGVDLPLRRVFESPTVAELVGQFSAGGKLPQGLTPVSRGQRLPLSFAQQRLWFLQQLAPENPFYNMFGAFDLRGELDMVAWHGAINTILGRHEALRTVFQTTAGRAHQVVLPHYPRAPLRIDLRTLPTASRSRAREWLLAHERQRPFDLAAGLEGGGLVRICLAWLEERRHLLLLTVHHIVADGWSTGVFFEELTTAYNAILEGTAPALPELPIQYVDFALWQRSWFQGAVLEDQLRYWRGRLEPTPAPLELPLDRPRPEVERYRGGAWDFLLQADLVAALRAFGHRGGATLSMVLMAAFKTLLHRISGQREIAVGTAVANRTRRELEHLIGFFVNTLVLRTDLAGDPSFEGLLAREREVALGAYAHQDLPFERLVDELGVARDLSRNPLCQVMFGFQNFPASQQSMRGLSLEPLGVAALDTGAAKFDLILFLAEQEGCLQGVLEYNSDLFDPTTIRRLARHLQNLLHDGLVRPEVPLSRLRLLSAAERHQALQEWNATASAFPSQRGLASLFEQGVEHHPAAIALVDGAAHLSYGTLNRRANRRARHLRHLKVGVETVVGLCAERSPELVVGMVAILKAGGAYLPLDPDHPAERLRFMLEDARTPVVLADGPGAETLRGGAGFQCFPLGYGNNQRARWSAKNLKPASTGEHLAYVIYTSGSTGQPKGVAVVQRAVSRLVRATDYVQVESTDRLAQASNAAFDAATFEIWGALLNGACAVVTARETLLSPTACAQHLHRYRVNTLFLTTALFNQLGREAPGAFRSLRHLLFGGEAVDAQRVRATLEGEDAQGGFTGRLLHVYGPTESTTFSTWQRVERVPEEAVTVPIGRPLANTTVLVLDVHQRPVAVGSEGELYIAGPGLARGYLARPALTAEKFIPNPVGGRVGDRLYRTGDRVVLRAAGAIEFRGRFDYQVKVRGFRIELGEIEVLLRDHPAVQSAVVMAREEDGGERRLVAYVVLNQEAAVAADPTAAHAAEHIAPRATPEPVAAWESRFDYLYAQEPTEPDPSFNIIGWNSTYDGLPIPRSEMVEWLEDTIERIHSLKPRRILEIGCGTGMLLFRLAPRCESYLGADLSATALDYLRPHVASLPQVQLMQRPADDFTGVAAESVNGVILNSVVQYFPSIDYLAEVLQRSVDAVESGGFIFVGDVRSLPLLEAYHTSLELHRATEATPLSDLRQRIRRGLRQENELVVAPEFFTAFGRRCPRVARVTLHPKRGRGHNELTRFRYQAVLHVGDEKISDPPPTVDWGREGLSLETLRRRLRQEQPERLMLCRVPNARVATAARAVFLLEKPNGLRSVGDLLQELHRESSGGVEPQDFHDLSQEFPYAVELGWSQPGAEGTYEVLLARCSETEGSGESPPPPRLPGPGAVEREEPWSHYANRPLSALLTHSMVPELRHFLAETLPEHMVPATFVALDELPLTANGKVDRDALPVPERDHTEFAGDYVAPRTDRERALAEVWSTVLGIGKVGLHDNFFELGGDSILAIQVISRAQQAGLSITPRLLFEHQTVAELAAAAVPGGVGEAEQGVVLGKVPLLPIQRWFFERDLPRPEHFNQSVLLETQRPLEPRWLAAALARLLEHHDALRLRFRHRGGNWEQVSTAPDGAPPLAHCDLSALPPDRRRGASLEAADQTQTSLHLGTGPLLRVVVFQLGDSGTRERVLLAIHHLVVDAVSWRILLTDLETAYRQLAAGQAVQLPRKTTSYKEWAERLVERAGSKTDRGELAFWSSLRDAAVGHIPLDLTNPGGNLRESAETLRVELSTAETDALLHDVPPVYHTRIDDVLLTALALCLREWTGAANWRVHLEGHGREEIFEGVDLSRTVGWFTTLFPVQLQLGEARDPGTALKLIKEQLRAIPHRGLGFGLLRHLGSEDVRRQLRDLPPVEVAFNYLGQLDRVLEEDSLFRPSAASKGETVHRHGARAHLLEINGGVLEGRLEMTWSYSRDLHRRRTIERVATAFLTALRSILRHCQAPGAGGHTPSDFPLADLDQPTLDRLFADGDPVEDLYPLSPLQGGMLFHTLEAPESGVYVQQMSCLLVGELDLGAFEHSWDRLLHRHTVLRTSFVWQEIDRPLQRVQGKVTLPFVREDWRGSDGAEQLQRLRSFLGSDRQLGFQIDRAPLMRLALFRTGDTTHRLVWTFHHLLLDGWCLPPLLAELFTLYGSLRRGDEPRLGPATPYRDYIAWLEYQDAERVERFWRRELEGFDAPSRLDLAAPTAPRSGPERCELSLSRAITEGLEGMARRLRLTLNTLMQGAWALLLSRYTDTSDVVFGVTFSGRPPELAGVESILGLFINTLPLRVEVAAEVPLTPWLGSLQDRQAELRDVEWSPLAQVQRWSQVPRGVALFDTLLVFENYPVDADLLQQVRQQTGLELTDLEFSDQTNYPLTLVAGARAELALHSTFDPTRFERSAMDRLLRHLETLLGAMLEDPEAPLGRLPLLTPSERTQLVARTAGEVAPQEGSPQRLLHEEIEARVAAGPEAIAVVLGAVQCSYGELDRRANRLAHRLRGHGVAPDVPVGLCVERSAELVVGILAILKADGAYVPLDPTYPQERLEFIRRDAGLAVILTSEPLAGNLGEGPGRVLFLDQPPAVQPPEESLRRRNTRQPGAEQLAYLIYTSGSTGRPKGAAITHRNVQRLFSRSARWFDFGEDDAATLFHSYAFDFSVWEIFSALLYGGRLVVVPHDVSRNPQDFLQLLCRERVTLLSQTPTAFRQLNQELNQESNQELNAASRLALRCVVLGGEAFQPRTLTPWFEHAVSQRATVVNMYGITETTVHVTYRPIVESDLAAAVESPIGDPLPDLGVWLLDRHLRPMPQGAVGEILVGGAGLARGYWLRSALTAERFVPHPWSARPGARLYRSGDRARRLEDGRLEFLGRGDSQLKIRGFRIEPGEIEATLLEHPAVAAALVIVRADHHDHKSLVAYFVAREGAAPEDSALRELLATRLPSYMVPAYFVSLAAFPRTANGKLDRGALPAPVRQGGGAAEQETAPATDTEQMLAQIWGEVLNVEQVGVEDNFFALGGDSILAIQIISRAARRGLKLTPRQIFEHQTIATLAPVAAHRTGPTIDQGPVVGPAPLTPIQHWFFARELPRPEHHNQAVLLRVRQPLERVRLQHALTKVVGHHDALRLCFERQGVGPESAWVQTFQEPGIPIPCLRCDLSSLPSSRRGGALEAAADQIQASLDLRRGPILRTVLFDRGANAAARLLIVAHHLVVDVVSWRILLEDLEAAYLRLAAGEAVEMPPKTTSFKVWGERLEAYAETPECRSQAPYWLARQQTHLHPLPVDFPNGLNTPYSARSRLARLSAAETQTLLKEVPPVYRTQINDTLLAALTMGYAAWSGQRALVVDLEGHGREEIFPEVDLSRTVGWFTTISPVCLTLPERRDVETILKSIKEQLRAVPERGLGFGALRYLTTDEDLGDQLRSLPPVEVAFNYLGQTDQILAEGALFQLTTEPCGRLSDPFGRRAHRLEINSGVLNGCLEIVCTYSTNLHRPERIEALVNACMEALRSILDHCQSQQAGGVTPSDFPLADFDQDELEDLLGEIEFE